MIKQNKQLPTYIHILSVIETQKQSDMGSDIQTNLLLTFKSRMYDSNVISTSQMWRVTGLHYILGVLFQLIIFPEFSRHSYQLTFKHHDKSVEITGFEPVLQHPKCCVLPLHQISLYRQLSLRDVGNLLAEVFIEFCKLHSLQIVKQHNLLTIGGL